MPCCKCIEFGWPDPQHVIYTEGAGQDYCQFHAPAEHKGMSVEDFNAQVFARIDAVKTKNTANNADDFCDLSGTIFPGDIFFNEYDIDNPLPSIFFGRATFSGGVSFKETVFGQGAIFKQTTFDGKADFFGASFGGIANFERALFRVESVFWGAIFSSEATFMEATFSNEATFPSAKFNKGAVFSRATFSGWAVFNGATFNGMAYFTAAAFCDVVIFSGVTFTDKVHYHWVKFSGVASFEALRTNKNALRMQSIKNASLANLNFTSMETECFSFKGCDWPESLWPETHGRTENSDPDYKACEELYRSLKQKAAGEHDQPLVSKWHYREKLMGLKKLISDKQALKLLDVIEEDKLSPWRKARSAAHLLRLAPGLLLSLNFWYWAISGYGEREKRAGVLLALLAVLPFVLNAFPHPIEAFPFSEQVNNALAHFPFAKDIQGQGGWLRLGKGLSQLLLALQATLFGLALRNRFRR